MGNALMKPLRTAAMAEWAGNRAKMVTFGDECFLNSIGPLSMSGYGAGMPSASTSFSRTARCCQPTMMERNGGPVKGAKMLATLQALGVIPSLSRPRVSNDSPFPEALFKTLKYRPAYALKAFDTLLAARTSVGALLRWYNHEHRHSAIRFTTPAQRHATLDLDILDRREALFEATWQRNPLRSKGSTGN